MFSGIIEQIGVVKKFTPLGRGYQLKISSPLIVGEKGTSGVGTPDRERIGLGDSIAVMGVCLTVEKLHPPSSFTLSCGIETISKTTLRKLTVGDSVHLERATRVGDRLDGHLVQGHVDGIGNVISMNLANESWILWVEAPIGLSKYIATKGSITIDGVSLTVNEVRGACFRVNVVPYTATETLLSKLKPGSEVNLEVDIIARYVESLLSAKQSQLSVSRLIELGYHSKRGK